MTTVVVVAIIIGLVVLAGVVVFAVWYARRRAGLRQRFGPQYAREVRARGGERAADEHLGEVVDRRDRLDIRELEPTARERYTQRWRVVQTEFVDRPGPALDEADRLVTEVMRDRGYPVEDFGERAELVAADHPEVVEHYRAAHAARQVHHDRPGTSNTSDTEDLRQAFVHYRVLFDELVQAW